MKFNVASAPEFPSDELMVGNVYLSKNSRKTKYWICIGITQDDMALMLGINKEGEITSVANYGRHCFEDRHWCQGRKPIGRVIDMPEMNLTIEWSHLP